MRWWIALALLALLGQSSVAGADPDPVPPAAVAIPSPVPSPIPSPCEDAAVGPRLVTLLRAHRFADVHHAVVGLRVLCAPSPALEAHRVLDDIALLRLEDRAWALSDLQELSRGARAETANVVLAWAYAMDRDTDAARAVLARIPAPRAAAIAALAALDDRGGFASHAAKLPGELGAPASALAARYHAARRKHPAVAGILSALIPGAGQLYAGSVQAAAVTFVLNGLFIGATIELALDRRYVTAAAAGTAASVFYVGGILNAGDLARRRNELASQPSRDALEELLVPELTGSFPPP
ncbi:MAG: hypothetical protein H6Q90_7107 [Deltaproteobacteria bacterium]|nr:hypothetical protein [Deltaproteobacteria bacterium]